MELSARISVGFPVLSVGRFILFQLHIWSFRPALKDSSRHNVGARSVLAPSPGCFSQRDPWNQRCHDMMNWINMIFIALSLHIIQCFFWKWLSWTTISFWVIRMWIIQWIEMILVRTMAQMSGHIIHIASSYNWDQGSWRIWNGEKVEGL